MYSFANKMMIGLTIVVCVIQLGMWYNHLPDVVPSHFNSKGIADGEMGKKPFTMLFAGLHVMLLVGFPLLGLFLKRLPDSTLNIPNKEYWLAPERREQTLATNTTFLNAMGWMTSWLMIAIFHLSATVAVGVRQTVSPETNWLIGIYLVAIFGSVAWLILRFRLPADAEPVQIQGG